MLNPETVLRFADTEPDVTLRLTPGEIDFLRLVDGQRTIARIATDAGMDGEQAVAIAHRLASLGVLQERPEAGEASAVSGPGGEDQPPGETASAPGESGAAVGCDPARTLVPRLDERYRFGTVGVDPGQLISWEEQVGHQVNRLALYGSGAAGRTKRARGRGRPLRVEPAVGAGEALLANRDTLLYYNLHVGRPAVALPFSSAGQDTDGPGDARDRK